jgi:hypothetical protein
LQQVQKRFIDTLVSHSTGFYELNLLLRGKEPPVTGGHFPSGLIFLNNIQLVANEHDFSITLCTLSEIAQPFGAVLKGIFPTNVIDQQTPSSVMVMASTDGTISLLSRGIPNLGPLIVG